MTEFKKVKIVKGQKQANKEVKKIRLKTATDCIAIKTGENNEYKIKKLKDIKKQDHNPDYNNLVPQEIFDIEDSDEIAEMYGDMFGY